MKKDFEILPPSMPNFVRFKLPTLPKQDGFAEIPGYDIANFTEKEAIEFSDIMKATFMEHWRNRKFGQKNANVKSTKKVRLMGIVYDVPDEN